MAFKMKGHTLPGIKQRESESSSSPYQKNGKYGKRHDRLQGRMEKLDERSLDVDNVSDKKSEKLQERYAKLAKKSKKIRDKQRDTPTKKTKADPASVTSRRNEGDKKGARIEKRRGKAAAKGKTGKAKRLARKLAAHDATDNRGKQKARTVEVGQGGRIEF
jgi:hypothetical protein